MTKAFFAEDDEDERAAIVNRLQLLTGSEQCGNELADAADEVEQTCGPLVALSEMPWTVN
jgi:hypothetical protein